MVKIETKDLHIWFGQVCALASINLQVFSNEILSIIGPANSGKTTFLRALNRLNDLAITKMKGTLLLDNKDIYKEFDILTLRKKIGMVFALPVPLPMSVFENVSFGPRLHGINSRKRLFEIVEEALSSAFLWDEVKDRLDEPAYNLSGGQQQRLCIARTLANQPEVILFDEPCSGLDPISTAKVEEAMNRLKKNYTIILVTNNTKQAARVSDRVAFFLMGELIEIGDAKNIFTAPSDKRTEDYVAGRFG